jgi:hypothetical protein
MERGDLPRDIDPGWSRMHYGRHPVGPRNDEECSRSSPFRADMEHFSLGLYTITRGVT